MEIVTRKKEGHELHVQAVWFAAGTAAFMACLERAVLVSFVEQWRVLVFLALNLLLLAILFTSRHPNSSSFSSSFTHNNQLETEQNRIRSSSSSSVEETLCLQKQESSAADDTTTNVAEEINDAVVDEEEEEEEEEKCDDMSKEELNERADAFIAMFRQHLASDAKTTIFV